MKIVIEIDDREVQRMFPCDKNGEHNHAKCAAEYIESGLLGGVFKRELEEETKLFHSTYKRPGLSVTTE